MKFLFDEDGEMAGDPWLKFFPSDWRGDPRLGLCSLAARGLWLEMISVMHGAEPYGHLTFNGSPLDESALHKIANCSREEADSALAELERFGVFSRTDGGVIYSRRMVRDREKLERARELGRLGGSPSHLDGKVAKSNRAHKLNRKDNPTKVEEVWRGSEGVCDSCRTPLRRDNPNAPDAFTINYIIPTEDGGTNDLPNLKALCRQCSRQLSRSRRGLTPPESEGVQPIFQSPDTRIQNPDGGTRKRRALTPIPQDWAPKNPPTTEAGKRELAKMRDWALANDVRRKDWDAQWRNWKRKAVEFMKRDAGPDPGRVRYT